MKVEYNIGSYKHTGKVIATVVMQERSRFSNGLEPPQIYFVIELPNGLITHHPAKDCQRVRNILQRILSKMKK